ncbi:MAG TPA: 50S ribosomal protein L23 [Atribacteraceae bacterium]|nr:50S ribosomal protein L23 [Atribacteraceae bacterium]
MSHDRAVLVHPVISEKAVKLQAKNKYVFRVDARTTKNEIKKAVNTMFGVTVTAVNVITAPSKKKRLGRFEGMTSSWKKAVVTVKAGEKIKAFDIT